mmetsp:Transcript_32654/g.104228  ORF Transcript_32654/g.104228 Transcript_32654/m.104228 type:complete len:351 (-) Transcript_32654:420-1472(-)
MTATTTRLPRRATRAVILRESSVTATLLRTRNFGPWVSLLDDEGLLQPDLLMARPGLRLLLQDGHTMEDVELAHVARLVKIAVDARGLHDEGAAGEKRLFLELSEIVRLVHRERAHIVAQGLQEAALVLDTSRARDPAVRNLGRQFEAHVAPDTPAPIAVARGEAPSVTPAPTVKDPFARWDKESTFTSLLGNVEVLNWVKTPPEVWPVTNQVRAVFETSHGAHPHLPDFRSHAWEANGSRNECPRRRNGEYEEPFPHRHKILTQFRHAIRAACTAHCFAIGPGSAHPHISVSPLDQVGVDGLGESVAYGSHPAYALHLTEKAERVCSVATCDGALADEYLEGLWNHGIS